MLIFMIFDPVFVQATTTQLQSELSELKNRLEAQETETQKANSKFEFSVAEQEKLTSEFGVVKKAWAEEKIALTQRAETAETALEEVTTELSGLKRHVSQMVSAIFGKSACKCQILNFSSDHMNCHLTYLILLCRPQELQPQPGHAGEAKGGLHARGTTLYWISACLGHSFPVKRSPHTPGGCAKAAFCAAPAVQ